MSMIYTSVEKFGSH